MPDLTEATRLKSDTLQGALANAIPILRGLDQLGQLVPVGDWILTDDYGHVLGAVRVNGRQDQGLSARVLHRERRQDLVHD